MTKKRPGAVRGRPSLTGAGIHSPQIGLRLPAEELDEIEALVPEYGKDKSAVVRSLVALGLQTVRRRKARAKNKRK